ncbi:hypothetical protein DRP04_15005, partial [Archaeoglobales archaeon]
EFAAGVGFRLVKEVVETQETTQEETTTTGAAGGTAITITTPNSLTLEVGECKELSATIENTGSGNGTVYGISLQGAEEGLTYGLISVTPPFTLYPGDSEQIKFEICAEKEGSWEVKICALVGGVNFCSSSITIESILPPSNITQQNITEEENITTIEVEYMEKDGIYEINVSSDIGPLKGAKVKIVYPNGEVETYTTDDFGRVTFTPLTENFQIVVEYGNLTKIVQVEKEVIKGGLTFGRILVDVLILAVLMIIGIMLDEKLI